MNNYRATVLVPARNEDQFINVFLDRIDESVTIPVEILIIVDNENDSTIAAVGEKISTARYKDCNLEFWRRASQRNSFWL
jgi:antitoxin component of RelBE/YafQ-DinJ toxin-antitoxin module